MFPTVSKAGLVGLNFDPIARAPAGGGWLRVLDQSGGGEGLQEAEVICGCRVLTKCEG